MVVLLAFCASSISDYDGEPTVRAQNKLDLYILFKNTIMHSIDYRR